MLFLVQFYDLYAFYNKASKIKIVVHGTYEQCKGFQIMSILAFNLMHFQLQFKIKRKLRAFEQICLISD